MLSKLLPVILLVIGTGGGIGAGLMLMPAPEEHAETSESHGGEPAEAGSHAEAEDEPAAFEYLKLNNQFVVPVVEKNEITSMVVNSARRLPAGSVRPRQHGRFRGRVYPLRPADAAAHCPA